MKAAALIFAILVTVNLTAQTASKPAPPAPATSACPDRPEMQDELTDTRSLVARMQNRIIVMRNAAGTISDFELRSALQVNTDAWQDLLDSLKHRLDRLQTMIDRCDARTKIESAKPK